MTPQATIRSDLVAFLRREIVGPDTEDEVVDESPRKRYSAGILFPRVERDDEDASPLAEDEASPEAEGEDPGAWQEAPPDTDSDDEAPRKASEGGSVSPSDDNDEGVLLANTYFPAAMGLTFLVDRHSAAEVVVQVSAALYDPFDDPQPNGKPRRRWRRRLLAPDQQRFRLEGTAARMEDREPVEGLGLRLVRRDRTDGTSLLTVSLANRRPPRSGTRPPSARDCFFQVGFSIRAGAGQPAFLPTDVVAGRRGGSEEESLALLYRMRRQFAVGHGCAAEWGPVAEGRVADLSTETVPGVVVPPIEATGIGGKALDIHHLAGLDGGQEDDIPETLTALTSEYARWLTERESEAARLTARLTEAARRHLAACREALRRMEAGIALLRSNGLALRAFMLANRSILMQQHHSKLPNRELQDAWPEAPDNYRLSALGRGRWRSFQIAFLLMNIHAFMQGSDGFDDVRNVVDLIWFPTGGGKTEAYLGVTAYAIFLRRLLRPANGGCTVLMRYTLRLLTAQQFQRAASLICACELIRSQDEKRLGAEPISLGLWVGGQASPNKREDAVKALGQLARPVTDDDRRRENPFQLLACPWCGTRLDRPKSLGYVADGKTVVFRCPDKRCTFGRPKTLPVSVIDEDLYASPPTLVIGTVDKFAMLAWRPESASLFGRGRSGAVDPPDLIVQDELHLIAGPLGSMVGLYEAAIEYLCTGSSRPKIIASTATIRRAQEQCVALYDRPAFQFPPPGLDVGDSFFAKEDATSDGRLYVGVFASAAPSPVTALVRTASALHQGAASVSLPAGGSEGARDPYWTQLQYFGSLRELGRAATLVEQDIPEYLQVIRKRLGLGYRDIRRIRAPVELTSRLTAEQVPEILEDLKIPYGQVSKGTKPPIDVLLATNMISVGVDVDRLGLMVVVGQPKTTSEYIQASSRVGRSKDAPGLVVTLYNAGKPRDRSHFESFRAYHEAFYRYVEPTSVTPFAVPVLERGLHALLVTAARHLSRIRKPGDLKRDDKGLAKFIEHLKRRSESVDPEHAPEVARRVKELMDAWFRLAPPEFGSLSPYDSGPRLIVVASAQGLDADDPAWRTPTSMRNVDAECAAKVLQDDPYAPEETS